MHRIAFLMNIIMALGVAFISGVFGEHGNDRSIGEIGQNRFDVQRWPAFFLDPWPPRRVQMTVYAAIVTQPTAEPQCLAQHPVLRLPS